MSTRKPGATAYTTHSDAGLVTDLYDFCAGNGLWGIFASLACIPRAKYESVLHPVASGMVSCLQPRGPEAAPAIGGCLTDDGAPPRVPCGGGRGGYPGSLLPVYSMFLAPS